jgi:outer membrane protein TolC
MLPTTGTMKKVGALAALLVCIGCEVTPDPISKNQHAERAEIDIVSLQNREFVPTKPITLHEAMARAVALNLKRRVSYIERRIAEAELDQSNFEMLPTLQLSAGKDRSDVQISQSDDRITQSANASFTWNILDLGVSYARAKQRADEVLIAKERERKALQDIIRQVNVAFWRAASGQKLLTQVKLLATDLRTAMRASREMEESRATDVLTAVAFRRDIVDSVRKALAVQRELKEAKAELAELLNIRPGRDFELALPATQIRSTHLPISIEQMERHSLQNRPELRIEDYNERISEWQAREALYNMLPGLDLSVARNYSSETSNLSPNWISTGFQLGMNLFSLFSGPSEIEEAEKRGELARQQRLAMSVAVLTQVHIAHIKYREASQQMRLVGELANSDRRLTRLIRTDGTFQTTNFLDAVRVATRHLQSEMEEQRAHIDLISAHADLIHAIGLDVVPDPVPLNNLAALEDSIAIMMAGWNLPRMTQAAHSARTPIDRLVDSMISPSFSKAPSNAVAENSGADVPQKLSASDAKAETVAIAQKLNLIAPSSDGSLRAATATLSKPLDWEIAIGPRMLTMPAVSPRKSQQVPRYLVSLGAYRDQASAYKLRDRLALHPNSPLGGTDIEVVFRSSGKGHAYYYVQTSAKTDRRTAKALCRSLKHSGRDCFIAKVAR